MIWDDTGFLLFKNRYNENSLISEIYTKNHGKCSGIIFGASSKKIINGKVHLLNKLKIKVRRDNTLKHGREIDIIFFGLKKMLNTGYIFNIRLLPDMRSIPETFRYLKE